MVLEGRSSAEGEPQARSGELIREPAGERELRPFEFTVEPPEKLCDWADGTKAMGNRGRIRPAPQYRAGSRSAPSPGR